MKGLTFDEGLGPKRQLYFYSLVLEFFLCYSIQRFYRKSTQVKKRTNINTESYSYGCLSFENTTWTELEFSR